MRRNRLTVWSALAFGLLGCFGIGCRNLESGVALAPRTLVEYFAKRSSDSGVMEPTIPSDGSAGTSAALVSASQGTSPAKSAAGGPEGEDARLESLAQSALEHWSILVDEGRSQDEKSDAWQAYHRDVKALLRHALATDRLDVKEGITVTASDGSIKTIRIERHGFPWRAADFNQLRLVSNQRRKSSKPSRLARYWQEPGLGIPLVGLRIREQHEAYHGNVIPFSITAVLRPPTAHRTAQVSHRSEIAVLDLYDPLSTFTTELGDRDYHLHRDLSAPLAHSLDGIDRDNVRDFLCPDHQQEGVGLRMLAPYQRGKIPIVFVHGLLSDRVTWIDLVNDLRAIPWFNDRYQIWAYQYPTGQSFQRSGAEMRSALRGVMRDVDPDGRDAALSQMVLVGHSMGGLVSKLQISYSGSSLWDWVANRPVDQLKAPDDVKETIRSMFFFEPQPFVTRVVFIGTPHLGSDWATSWIGRVGSNLVRQPEDRVTTLHELMRNNPHVFNELCGRLPTSIDLLRPDSPLLLATYQLPVDPRVRMHSIIGTGKALKDDTPADGVVAVSHARHPGVESERLIDATHTKLPDHPETTTEITRILSEHLRSVDAAWSES